MMNLITKGYIATQLKTEEFMKDNRGSIIEYVMIIALAAILIASAKGPLEQMVNSVIDAAKDAVNIPKG
ncbi:pilus assembly protein [Yersinia bercovieri]|uniref:pilus assembly protein n=1 Tax=Yersinia bercovieri TaxID=634 RepID=UPI0011A3E461|nr:pilus assembly protein [Yersinia bercovieri]MCB5302411.1 pilus assembly protein [Yersinia bercovieri]